MAQVSALSVAQASMAVIKSMLLLAVCMFEGGITVFEKTTRWTTSEVFQCSNEHFLSDPSLLHLGMCLLEEASCVCYLTSPRVVSFSSLPLGVEEQALHLPSSGGFINDGRRYFGGRGKAHRPLSSSHSRGGLPPRLRGWGSALVVSSRPQEVARETWDGNFPHGRELERQS